MPKKKNAENSQDRWNQTMQTTIEMFHKVALMDDAGKQKFFGTDNANQFQYIVGVLDAQLK